LKGPIIRELNAADLEAVYMIEVGSYPTPWTRNFFRLMAHTAPELFLVAQASDEVIGYTVGEVDTRANGRRLGHIMNIAVTGSHRNQGVGSALLDELEDRFVERGAVAAYLEVRESNLTAQRLYEDRGYGFLRKAAGYYGDEDGYVMTKALRQLNG
jgi:ribosomal-protein-alanine N-acetyltransferase